VIAGAWAVAIAGACILASSALAAGPLSKSPPLGAPFIGAAPPGKPAPPLTPNLSAGLPRGYVVVSSGTLSAVNGSQTRGRAVCPVGDVPLGGGVFVESGSTLANVNSSFPVASGSTNEWVADVNNASGFDTPFDVRAVCAKQPRNYQIVEGNTVDNPSGNQNTSFATCPRGSKPLGGGAFSNSFDLKVNINSTLPEGPNWRVDENNGGTDDATVNAEVVCGRVGGYQVVQSGFMDNPPGDQTGIRASCPAPTAPIGGGIFSNSGSVGVNVNTTAPVGSGWDSFENNGTPFDQEANAFVVCAGR
jgi:hypothetical protein